jgi:hypothetical protein
MFSIRTDCPKKCQIVVAMFSSSTINAANAHRFGGSAGRFVCALWEKMNGYNEPLLTFGGTNEGKQLDC